MLGNYIDRGPNIKTDLGSVPVVFTEVS